MPLVIATNVAEMRSRRFIDRNERASARTLERLASGDRINRASDDAAGLGIAERVGAHRRSINAAMRNAGEGISVMQTAESAMQTQAAVLTRMRELAIQAANGLLTPHERQQLQSEIQQLQAELDRVGDDTEFNEAKLLDGSYQDKTLRLSALAGGRGELSFDVSLDDTRSSSLGAVASVTGSSSSAITAGSLVINGFDVAASSAADDTVSTAANERSAIAKAATINRGSATHGVTAQTGATTATALASVAAGDLAAGDLVINGTDITISGVGANDGAGVLAAAVNAHTGQTGVAASVDEAGVLSLTAADGRNIELTVTANGSAVSGFAATAQDIFEGDLTLTSRQDILLQGDPTTSVGIASGIHRVDAATAVKHVDVSSQAGANSALTALDQAIDGLSDQRTVVGARINRLTSAQTQLHEFHDALELAGSKIKSADMAKETAELARVSVSRQARVAVLAQARDAGSRALDLLA